MSLPLQPIQLLYRISNRFLPALSNVDDGPHFINFKRYGRMNGFGCFLPDSLSGLRSRLFKLFSGGVLAFHL